MRWTTTAVLAVLLAGLATFYYVYEVRQAPDREKAAAVKDHLWKGVEAKDVEEIVRLAQPIVVHRSALEPATQPALSPFARARLAIGRLTSPPLDVSSTELRAELARGGLPEERLTPALAAWLRARAPYGRP